MKLLLTILACLVAASAGAQTIKSLGYNTTNGQVVYSGTNSLTFTNALQFSTNARAATRTNLGGTTVGNSVFTATNAAAARSAIGAGTVNEGGEPSFESVTANLFTAESINEATGGLQALDLLNFSLTFGTNYVLEWSATDVQLNKPLTFLGTNTASTTRTNLGLGAFKNPDNYAELLNASGQTVLDVEDSVAVYRAIDWAGTNSETYKGATRTNLGLGATNNVTFSNITASGTLAVTGNVTLSGVNNTMPNATNAASASSLMTRDLVGQELANPRTKMQTTYWFGLEGLGEWSLIGSGAIGGYGGASGGIGGGQYIYSSQTVGTNHAGAALRLGSDTAQGTTGIYRFSDGGALTMRVRMRKGDTLSVPAIAFVMGLRTATEMWQQNSYGIYFVPQPTNSWVSNAVVTQNSRIAVSNVVWAVNTAGTNAATEPTWTDLIGSLVTNGSAVYRNLGPHTSNNYVLAIGSTNASQVAMTNTGKAGPVVGARQEIVLKLRIDGTTSTPYTVYGSVENSAGESAEVSLTTTNNDSRQPQIWSRPDNLGTRTNSVVDMLIRYFSVDGVLNPL